ncbi:MAG: class I SAM-dependent methyltransferase [Maribacter sp.]|uniref:class I SAM-dependent methyltransferase n=1 Tax=Maribacter sp. TaxID=1897614 RepID=UPI003C773EDF
MDNTYQETFKTWNKIAQQYEDSFMDLELYNDTYDIFCGSIHKKNASLLEIGCGPGNITKYISTRNPSYKIHAIDVSKKMIELARKNNPNTDFEVMDCRNLTDLQKIVDGVICGFTIPYISKSDCTKLFYNCCNLLKENGMFYVSFVAGHYKNSGFIKGSAGDRVYFHFHELERIKEELEKNSLSTIHLIDKEYQKLDGTTEVHTIIIARKNIG